MTYIDIDLSQAKRLERILAGIRERSVGFAIKNTLNDLAFAARRNIIAKIDHDFVNRNSWTKRSIKVERARYTGDHSEVGSTERYMAKQEFGGTGERYVANPNASGENSRARVRRKPIRQSNWINKLTTASVKRTDGNLREKNISSLKQAKEQGQKYVILDRGGGRRGLYRVLGTKKAPRSKLLYTLRNAPVKIKKHATIGPVAEETQRKDVGALYFLRLRQELARAMRV